MSDKIQLKLDERTVTGKKVAALRRDGFVPGTIYGQGFEAINVMAPANLFEKVFKDAGKHHPVYLTIGDKKKIAMIKDADVDPVKRRLRHVSFHAVKQNEKVEADVPVKLVGEGESEAEKAGLVVLQQLETMKVHARPMDLPDALEVSIVHLTEPHQQILVNEIKLPDGVELDDAENVQELVIATVYEPSALQAANEAAAGGAEPESEGEEVAEVESEHGGDTDQEAQASEDRPGGKGQKEPKPSQL
jgi:large subunit ribosomal protein L25